MLYLLQVRKMIEEKLGWRPAEEWRNFEFTRLSDLIFDATGVSLSATTLKRIFGKVNYQSFPSTATLNTLSLFLGYGSWMDFKSRTTRFQAVQEETKPVEKSKPVIRKTVSLTLLLLLCASVLLSAILLPRSGRHAFPNPGNVVFKSRLLSEGLPNTVVFNVDMKQMSTDHIRIQQSWDSTKTIPLRNGQTEATGFYYYPGYYRAKLIADEKVIKEHDLFIRSEKWMATLDLEPVPTYIKPADLLFDHAMTVSGPVLKEVAKFEKPVFLTYHLVKPFKGLQSDNFTMETSLKNTYREGAAVCQTAKIFILGTNGAFVIPFSIPGCVSDINLKLYQTYLDGRSHDLSPFGTDLSDWNKVRLEVKNRHVRIFLKDKLIREQDYQADAGAIAGLRFSFLGAGAVRYVHVFDGAGRPVHVEDFSGE